MSGRLLAALAGFAGAEFAVAVWAFAAFAKAHFGRCGGLLRQAARRLDRSRLMRSLASGVGETAAALAFARFAGAELTVAVWAGAIDAVATAGLGGAPRHCG